jgi:3-hydroxyisobutyrate dehydrogenase-like beta-hydroxyacid dehydrogenase
MSGEENPNSSHAINPGGDNEPIRRVALIGFGEAGGILACDLAARGLDISAFDILFDSPAQRDAMLAKARDGSVRAAQSLQDCVGGLPERMPQLVISAVTASSAADVARAAAAHLRPGQLYLDINSVSPETKRRMAARISPPAASANPNASSSSGATSASRDSSSPAAAASRGSFAPSGAANQSSSASPLVDPSSTASPAVPSAAGAPNKSSATLFTASPAAHSESSAGPSRSASLADALQDEAPSRAAASSPPHALFVEAAVMAAVPPQRLKVPMLLGGPYAAEAAPRLRALGLNATALTDRYGIASAVKMCRSVLIKGLEALAVESMLAARRYGAEDEVLASLAATYPGMGWQERLPDYLISRVAEHGRRRAAEVREVAQALREVGVDPLMAAAIAVRQDSLVDEMATRGLAYDKQQQFSWRALADALASLTPAPKP